MVDTRRFLVAWIALALVPGEGLALERTTRAISGEREEWSRSTTVALSYYNICTGWVWSWSDFAPGERVGTTFVGLPGCYLVATSSFSFSGAPSGYGFTGTVSVSSVSQGCPSGPPLASQPFLPASLWSTPFWGMAVPSQFAVFVTLPQSEAGAAMYNFTSDRPAAGPTGPIACGTCYPTTRTTRSFLFGPESAPECPGTPLFDGFCNAELLMEAFVKCLLPVEPMSWGGIKALYR